MSLSTGATATSIDGEGVLAGMSRPTACSPDSQHVHKMSQVTQETLDAAVDHVRAHRIKSTGFLAGSRRVRACFCLRSRGPFFGRENLLCLSRKFDASSGTVYAGAK